jgi:hypothetical protein
MNKFKIGDKVRVINNDQRYSEDFTGQESEVIDSGPDWYEIKVQYKDGGYNFLTFNENELELVDNAPRSFKVGDRVRFDCPDLEVDYGTIVGRYAENSWWIDWESDGDRCHCEEKYLTVVEPEEQYTQIPVKTNAADILQQAKDCLVNRASERDKEQERSMKSCVDAFNALTGESLTETEGWIFMVVLKLARSQGGKFKLDDYVDMAAYAALAGESGSK